MEFSQLFNSYTLTLKNEDLEHEWLLSEINSRKTMTLVMSLVLILIDLLQTFFLAKVNFVGRTIKMVSDALLVGVYF